MERPRERPVPARGPQQGLRRSPAGCWERTRPAASPSELWVQWNNTVKTSLSRHKGKKYNLGALLRDCKVNSISLDGQTSGTAVHQQGQLWSECRRNWRTPASRKRLAEALTQSFGEGCDYQLTLANGQQSGGQLPPTLPSRARWSAPPRAWAHE